MRRPSLMLALVLASIGRLARGEDPVSFEEQILKAVDRARPSVVAIESTFNLRESTEPSPAPQSVVPSDESEAAPKVRSAFSGVIVSADGYIVTVATALQGAIKVEVTLSDDRQYVAEPVGTDPVTNIGVLRIQARDLPAVTFADPKRVRVGTWVLGIGNPYGLEQSVSQGLVSGTDRMVASLDQHTFPGMLQITAPVNPGDAGGLLCNTRGEMVGLIASTFQRAPSAANFERMFRELSQHVDMDAALARIREMLRRDEKNELTSEDIARTLQQMLFQGQKRAGPASEGGLSTSGGTGIGAEGINFALPADVVRQVTDQLMKDGKVDRGWFGVQAQALDPALCAQLELAAGTGVVLTQVVEEGPAAKAGLQAWDVLLSYDGKMIGRVQDLYRAVVSTPAGTEAVVEIIRGGTRKSVTVTIESGEGK